MIRVLLALLIAVPAAAQTDEDVRARLDEVLDLARTRHVDAPKKGALLKGAIEGALKALDPYSMYLDADEMARLRRHLKGKYTGIGVEIAEKGGRIGVIAPVEGGPAEAAGIAAGDVFITIAGKSTRGMTTRQSSELLLGEPGTSVTVRIRSRGKPARTLTIVRARIELEPVKASAFDDGGRRIAHVRLKAFQEDTVDKLEAALKGLGAVQGVVLDLRGNPGGLLDKAVGVVSLFVADGVVVTTEGQGGKVLQTLKVRGATSGLEGLRDPSLPLVVLIDRRSASASEIVAGSLQDHGRAVLVGRKSFGKGSVQSIVPLKSGDAVKLTTARYRLPGGRIVDHVGLPPDLRAPRPSKADADPALTLAKDVVRSWSRLRKR